jgi:hypothetical protein
LTRTRKGVRKPAVDWLTQWSGRFLRDARIEISNNWLSAWVAEDLVGGNERGERNPTQAIIADITKVFGIPIRDLFPESSKS